MCIATTCTVYNYICVAFIGSIIIVPNKKLGFPLRIYANICSWHVHVCTSYVDFIRSHAVWVGEFIGLECMSGFISCRPVFNSEVHL